MAYVVITRTRAVYIGQNIYLRPDYTPLGISYGLGQNKRLLVIRLAITMTITRYTYIKYFAQGYNMISGVYTGVGYL